MGVSIRTSGQAVVRSHLVKIALVGPAWPLRGGIAATTSALAAALARRGSLAAFVVPRRQYPPLLYPGSADTDEGACPRLEFAEPLFGVVEPWSWPAVARRLAEVGPDCLVIPYWTWVWAPFFLYLAHRSRTATLAVVHNPADHDAAALPRWAARAVLRRCGGFLCHARSVADQLGASYPGVPTVVHPLPHEPTDPGKRAPARAALGVPQGAIAALCFGLIRAYKGVDVLLDAVARLPGDFPLVLLLAGEPWGDSGRAVRARLAQPDLRGRVVARLEWIPEREADAWFAAADLAVLPYRSATGSAVAARALACGLPVVGSWVGGIAEVVEDGVNGLLVPPGNPDELARALLRLGAEDLRARLSAGARASAGRWSWASYAAALEALAVQVGTDGQGQCEDGGGTHHTTRPMTMSERGCPVFRRSARGR